MSEVTRNGKQLLLEGIIVSYRPKDDTIHITSTDPDLAGKPFHVSLNSGTETETALRELLVEKGIIQQDGDLAPLPKMAYWKPSTDPYKIAVGVHAAGVAGWNVNEAPHALVAGGTGSGKSVLQRSVFLHCLVHNQDWEFYGIDLKRVELTFARKYPQLGGRVATTLEDSVELLTEMRDEMLSRYDQMEREVVHSLNELKVRPKMRMVMVDDAFMLMSPEGVKTDEGRRRDQLHAEASSLLGDLARLGRAAGIHLLLATHRPDATVIKGELKSYLSVRIAVGRLDTTASIITLDNAAASNLPGHIRGRGIIAVHGKQVPFQTYLSLMEHVDGVAYKKSVETD